MAASEEQLGSNSIPLESSLFERHPALRSYDGKSVIVGIRPEDFEDASLAGEGDRRVTATVALVETLGSEIMVHFTIDASAVDSGDPDAPDAGVAGGSNAVGRFNPRSSVKEGEVAEIAMNTENLHFFDPSTRSSITERAR